MPHPVLSVRGRHIMRRQVIVLAAALAMAPLGASAADLVVWWEKGYYDQEDEAVRETIAAFEQGSGKQVEFVIYPKAELPDRLVAALQAGPLPDFAFCLEIADLIRNGRSRIGSWTSRMRSAASRTSSTRMPSTG
jgi:ABC-type glycerol-3-phosphate transport system substrate-binding protein